ncbi:hypothetical protein KM043_002141 [Ampulex compressa]|nr:hypothetical protein KM043_002141 [Ampulex compressa]
MKLIGIYIKYRFCIEKSNIRAFTAIERSRYSDKVPSLLDHSLTGQKSQKESVVKVVYSIQALQLKVPSHASLTNSSCTEHFRFLSSKKRKNPNINMKFIVFALIAAIAFAAVSAAPSGEASDVQTCSPKFGYCQVTEQCCRHLICSPYLAKCVVKGGIIVPGEDQRPIGPR